MLRRLVAEGCGEVTARERKVAIIAFPGITQDEAKSIADALRKASGEMGIAVLITNVPVETITMKELLSALEGLKV